MPTIDDTIDAITSQIEDAVSPSEFPSIEDAIEIYSGLIDNLQTMRSDSQWDLDNQ